MTRRPPALGALGTNLPARIFINPAAFGPLAGALLGSGRVVVTIEAKGESIRAAFAVRDVDKGGKARAPTASIVQIDEFQAVKVTT